MKYLGTFKNLIRSGALSHEDLYLVYYRDDLEVFMAVARISSKDTYDEYLIIPYFTMVKYSGGGGIKMEYREYNGNDMIGDPFLDSDEIFSLTNADLRGLIMNII